MAVILASRILAWRTRMAVILGDFIFPQSHATGDSAVMGLVECLFASLNNRSKPHFLFVAGVLPLLMRNVDRNTSRILQIAPGSEWERALGFEGVTKKRKSLIFLL